jgi:4-amino-4-deoxy-L-arabinose transferase-like glycosyltransferase
MYVHHAQNIVERRPYADTGYILNPSFAAGPKYYPPVFPILLAPIYRISGLSLVPMKLEQVLFLLLTLIVVYAYWKHDLGPGYTLALVAILGFAPAFWTGKDNVLSDIPFVFFFYLTALLVRSALRDNPNSWRWSALVGFAIYLAIGTRTIGIALAAGLVLYDVVRLRTVTRSTLLSILVCGALLGLQRYSAGLGLGGYPYEKSTLDTVARNLVAYARVLGSFWVGSTRNSFSYFVLALFAPLSLAGRLSLGKRGFTFVEAALIPYLTIIVLSPFAGGVRMVFPVVPWIGYLALSGLKSLAEKLAPRYSPATVCALILLVAVPYGQFYRKANFGLIRQTAGLPEFNQVCQAVRKDTSPNDPIIYVRARALSLYTGRPASVPNYLGDEAELSQWARNIHAKYLLTTNAFNDDHGFLERFVQNNARSFELVYENANFKLYRLRSSASG